MENPESQQFEFAVPQNQKLERLDKYLVARFPQKSRAYLQSLINSDDVQINGRSAKASHKVSPGEKITLVLRERPPIEAQPEKIPLDIIFEDEDILVVNKAAGMVVHPAYMNTTGTLVNALLYHCQNALSQSNGPHRPGIVHRLDKDTSGLLVVAKNDEAHAALAEQFKQKTAFRRYQAVVWGDIAEDSGTISTFLKRNPGDRRKMMITDDEEGKWAVTHFEVSQKFRMTTHLFLNLETGRTHQIRVHLAHIGLPVLGDPAYGGRKSGLTGLNKSATLAGMEYLKMMPRQALHAFELKLIHPKQKVELSFQAPLPEDFEKLLAFLQAEKNQF